MNMRKITSMTMLLSLAVLLLNSLILYVVPEGRVAYWSDWNFLGLTKGNWGEQHTTVGFLFLAAGLLHISYNWRPIIAYMKNKARQVKVFTAPFNIALALVFVFIIGTYLQVPPMSTIIKISESFKTAAATKYGDPPYGHAELSSLKNFSERENLNLKKSIELLESTGISISSEKETIKEIAKKSNRSPQQVYELIKPASNTAQPAISANGSPVFPDTPQSGWGKKILNDVCAEYGLQIETIIEKLADRDINAGANDAIKDIAAANKIDPLGIFEAIIEIAQSEHS
jgi:hypothetical protein